MMVLMVAVIVLQVDMLVEEVVPEEQEVLVLQIQHMEDLVFKFHQHLEIQYHNQDQEQLQYLVVDWEHLDQEVLISGLLVVGEDVQIHLLDMLQDQMVELVVGDLVHSIQIPPPVRMVLLILAVVVVE
jgi:hypothetical protein